MVVFVLLLPAALFVLMLVLELEEKQVLQEAEER